MNNLPDYKLEPLWEKAVTAADNGDTHGVVFLLKALAHRGVPQVFSIIGTLYESGGRNLNVDLNEAVKWYRKALVEFDDPIAHLGIGRAYYNGTGGVQQDFGKAFFHFQKAYRAEIPESGVYLGIMAYNGIAIKKDAYKAMEYFKTSAAHDFCLAYVYLVRIEFSFGHFIKAIKALLKAISLLHRLKKDDPSDRRLMGV
jgi:TPR repeat protein